MAWVESVVKQEKPDIVVLDMGDKFADMKSERSRHNTQGCSYPCS